MAKNRFELQGFEGFLGMLRDIGGSTDEAVSLAMYKGAGIIADCIDRQIDSISVRPDGAWGTPSKPIYGLTATQKRGLKESLGIAKFQHQGSIKNTHVGWDGYNDDGQANAMIARSLNSGTSWLKKDRIIDRSLSLTKVTVEQEMKKTIETEIHKCL